MPEEEKEFHKRRWRHHFKCHSDSIYGLGVIGALVYYLQNATTFGLVVVGIIKSIAWPAVLLYRVFTILKM